MAALPLPRSPTGLVSLDIGSVRLKERCLHSDPPTGAEIDEAVGRGHEGIRKTEGRVGVKEDARGSAGLTVPSAVAATDGERAAGGQVVDRRPDPDASGSGIAKLSDDDPKVTGKIAWAHLKELPDYYERLERMESQA